MFEMFEAEDLIKQAIKRYGKNIAVACSFGKDSVVVLHIALKHDPNIKVVFSNTGVEFPETIKYKNMLKEKWNLNLIETKPIKDFWTCAREYGLPNIRGKGKKRTPKCCLYCKERPAFLAYREHRIIAVMTGITAAESHQRAMLISRYDKQVGFCGQRYYSTTQKLWKLHPIAYWKDKDVWNYIRSNNIPINPVYTKWNGIYKRCGCLPCSSYIGWRKKLSYTHPKLYKRLLEIADPKQQNLAQF